MLGEEWCVGQGRERLERGDCHFGFVRRDQAAALPVSTFRIDNTPLHKQVHMPGDTVQNTVVSEESFALYCCKVPPTSAFQDLVKVLVYLSV